MNELLYYVEAELCTASFEDSTIIQLLYFQATFNIT